MENFLKVENLCKKYPIKGSKNSITIFDNVHFTMDKGDFVCIIGHSGCGKSTILNNLAGLDAPSGGTLEMAGIPITGPSLSRGVIFQNHSLLPWLSALENIKMAISFKFKKMSKKDIEERAKKFLKMVGLLEAADKRPAELSGGMKQRVGIARAFSIEPELLLMDEPFGALDALTRGKLQDKLIEICHETHQTTFMITHDIDEAILLADKILLMSDGPDARVAEAVTVDIPKPRSRAEIFKHKSYYDIRNYLVDFLVNRSGDIKDQLKKGIVSESDLPIIVDPHAEKAIIEQKKTNNVSLKLETT